ncbi:MAG TPA: hypothetical protein VIU63_10645 [Nitrospira sp.]
MHHWVHVLAGVRLALVFTILFPLTADAAPRNKAETLPGQTMAPAAVALETTGSEQDLRTQLRAKNGVIELNTARARFSQAPTGSFGFIAPQVLGLALVTQSPDLEMERVSPSNGYEIHKLADGNGMLVGFLSREILSQVTPSQRPKNVRIILYSTPSEKAPYIAAVPLVKLLLDRMPVRLDPKKADSPVMLDMDLQGTVNRKSPHLGQ